eukprot:Trichotokara_eunicae@DN4249_c0_g1_i1.p1
MKLEVSRIISHILMHQKTNQTTPLALGKGGGWERFTETSQSFASSFISECSFIILVTSISCFSLCSFIFLFTSISCFSLCSFIILFTSISCFPMYSALI